MVIEQNKIYVEKIRERERKIKEEEEARRRDPRLIKAEEERKKALEMLREANRVKVEVDQVAGKAAIRKAMEDA